MYLYVLILFLLVLIIAGFSGRKIGVTGAHFITARSVIINNLRSKLNNGLLRFNILVFILFEIVTNLCLLLVTLDSSIQYDNPIVYVFILLSLNLKIIRVLNFNNMFGIKLSLYQFIPFFSQLYCLCSLFDLIPHIQNLFYMFFETPVFGFTRHQIYGAKKSYDLALKKFNDGIGSLHDVDQASCVYLNRLTSRINKESGIIYVNEGPLKRIGAAKRRLLLDSTIWAQVNAVRKTKGLLEISYK